MAGAFIRSVSSGHDLDDIFARVAEDNGLAVAVAHTFTLPVRPWVIIYGFAEGDVEVLRIVDGRRDLSALFSEPR